VCEQVGTKHVLSVVCFNAAYPQHKVVLRDEDPEDTLLRMLGVLRVLKYKPPTHIET
jgi:hypothetical protein